MSADSPTLIQHHTKYLEIDGVDEIVMMTPSEHKLLHQRLRREGKCNIPPSELHKISLAAHRRTAKCAEHHKKYLIDHADEIKAYSKAYNDAYRASHRDEISAYQAVYYAEHKDEIKAQHAEYQADHAEEIKVYRNRYYTATKLEEAS